MYENRCDHRRDGRVHAHRVLVRVLLAALCGGSGVRLHAQTPTSCAGSDSAAAMAIRARLRNWVDATNRGDQAISREIWAPAMVGWFPRAPMFSDSAAYAVGGLPYRPGAPPAGVTYALRIEEVVVSGRIAAVHDVWTETRRWPGVSTAVSRVIRGSELWRCQPDGQWRIARYVSAPEPWTRVP
jgi:hypothetical protein